MSQFRNRIHTDSISPYCRHFDLHPSEKYPWYEGTSVPDQTPRFTLRPHLVKQPEALKLSTPKSRPVNESHLSTAQN
jgi:hypothetical protein